MGFTPFQIHQQTISQYLDWLNANAVPAGSQSTIDDPAAQSSFFTWRGTNYACNFTWTEQKYLDEGGYQPTHILVLEVLESMLVFREDGVPGPAVKEQITFQGKQFRVQVNKHSPGKYPQLTCWDLARGA